MGHGRRPETLKKRFEPEVTRCQSVRSRVGYHGSKFVSRYRRIQALIRQVMGKEEIRELQLLTEEDLRRSEEAGREKYSTWQRWNYREGNQAATHYNHHRYPFRIGANAQIKGWRHTGDFTSGDFFSRRRNRRRGESLEGIRIDENLAFHIAKG